MRISELIAGLNQVLANQGDLPVAAYDGLDPSELSLIRFVEIRDWTDVVLYWPEEGEPKQVVCLTT